MKFDPHHIQQLAIALDPATEATIAHATQLGNAGFEPGHTGQAYLEQGTQIHAGIANTITMLRQWSEASDATSAGLRQAVTAHLSTDQSAAGEIISRT